MRSIWCVIGAIYRHLNFDIKYPSNTDTQQSIATGFETASSIGFTNCEGCIDGILNSIQKPSEELANNA